MELFVKSFFLHTVESNINNLQTSFSLLDGIMTGTNIPDQSGPGSNGNKGDLHTLQISRIRASSSDEV